MIVVDVSGVIGLDLSEQSSSLSPCINFFFVLFLLLAIYVTIVVL